MEGYRRNRSEKRQLRGLGSSIEAELTPSAVAVGTKRCELARRIACGGGRLYIARQSETKMENLN
jgi:hypothetical protein